MYDPDQPVPRWTLSTMRKVAEQSPAPADAALRYANLGIPVFPCVPGGKQPLTANGFYDATSNARTVHAWWQRTPDANIGLPTGRRTGVVVVDIDVHGDANGFGSFERARAEGFGDRWGWLVRTPSGGLHAYYPAMLDHEQRSWQVPTSHVDFRGDGGYVIAPPSRIVVDGSEHRYEVIAVATERAATVDSTGLRRLFEPPRKTAAPPSTAPTTVSCRPDALARTVARTREGGRNRALFWASCRMAESGVDQAEARSWLLPAGSDRLPWPRRDGPGWPHLVGVSGGVTV